MSNNIMELKSGSDIRGIAIAGVAAEEINLTDEVIAKIMTSFAHWLAHKTSKDFEEVTVSVGHDSRLSAERIKNIIIDTLGGLGIKILDCGLSSTPAMFMTTIDLNCDAAIEITASHHPFNRNGFKFFTIGGGLEANDIEEILNNTKNKFDFIKSKNFSVKKVNYMKKYSERLRKIICDGLRKKEESKPLAGLKIIVDAGNGVGSFYATNVLEPLGADISGSQFLEPDGRFLNHMPNPEDKNAMRSIVEATMKNKADLGIIFDTDVDRAGAVDCDGSKICRNSLIALAATIALKNNSGGTIVTDSVTSDGLHDYIENELHGVHNRFKRGYKNVINEAKRLNLEGINCPLAIETSGHAAMRENYFLDDGAYLITKIIIELCILRHKGQGFKDILCNLKNPKESLEFRLNIMNKDFKIYGEKVINDLYIYASEKNNWNIVPDNKEGIRVSFDKKSADGWFLLRMSVHDPVMPLNIESNKIGGSILILEEFIKFIDKYKEIDFSQIKDHIQKVKMRKS